MCSSLSSCALFNCRLKSFYQFDISQESFRGALVLTNNNDWEESVDIEKFKKIQKVGWKKLYFDRPEAAPAGDYALKCTWTEGEVEKSYIIFKDMPLADIQAGKIEVDSTPDAEFVQGWCYASLGYG